MATITVNLDATLITNAGGGTITWARGTCPGDNPPAGCEGCSDQGPVPYQSGPTWLIDITCNTNPGVYCYHRTATANGCSSCVSACIEVKEGFNITDPPNLYYCRNKIDNVITYCQVVNPSTCTGDNDIDLTIQVTPKCANKPLNTGDIRYRLCTFDAIMTNNVYKCGNQLNVYRANPSYLIPLSDFNLNTASCNGTETATFDVDAQYSDGSCPASQQNFDVVFGPVFEEPTRNAVQLDTCCPTTQNAQDLFEGPCASGSSPDMEVRLRIYMNGQIQLQGDINGIGPLNLSNLCNNIDPGTCEVILYDFQMKWLNYDGTNDIICRTTPQRTLGTICNPISGSASNDGTCGTFADINW